MQDALIIKQPDPLAHIRQACLDLECFETDPWAASRILDVERFEADIVDPCAGPGVMTLAARAAGLSVHANDIFDYGFKLDSVGDFLEQEYEFGKGYYMNPPFSKTEAFVRHAMAQAASKIICFQRFAWWESDGREAFWDDAPPNRVYVCGSRATCWRHDLPKNERGDRFDPVTGKKMAGTSTAHAFFVWDEDNPTGKTDLLRLYKKRK